VVADSVAVEKSFMLAVRKEYPVASRYGFFPTLIVIALGVFPANWGVR
jgi:hypothetical protein